ncbi:hypothetical protein OIU84_006843 [Salix udensis]|uniref:Pentatricopeptide repeat-containing protein n=1 Tax=Salix udensis TaxID=889485 RepID=A0AAD6P2I9_9ROSI|nr:hypothetical protein OIU84_006843 [Salix udensis]
MLKLMSSTSRQIQTHLKPPCLRFTTESHPSSFLKLLCSLTGLTHGNHKSLSFDRRAFFCSGSSSGDGGDRGGFVEVEVRSGASEIGAEGGASDANYSSAIVPSDPRPEDYLMVYKRLKLALLLVKKEMETSKIQGRFLQGTIFPINKQDPNTLLLQLLNSGADPELTLRGFEAFKRAGDYGFKLSLISCNPLLSGLVKETENGDVEFVYREMIKRKIELNVISFNIVVNGLCKIGKLNRAGDVIEDMKVWGVLPNVITYNSLIDGYCKMGRIGKMYKADSILKEMIAKGICPNEGLRPNVVTYNTLINGLCSDGKVDEAVALRDQMVISDLEPNVVTHNVLIKGFCKNKTVNEAINLFNDMEKQGVDPNAMTYNTLIDAYCEDGRMEDAFALYNMMIVRGISPVVSTCNCLIAGLCRKGDVKAARNLMNEMVSKTLSADVVTFNILIDSLCKKGETRKAVKLLDEMFEKGLNPSHVTYNTLMDGYCREGNLRAALIGKLEDANGLLNEMLERGLVPNRTTYEIIKEEMMEKGFVPDIEGHVYNVSDTNRKELRLMVSTQSCLIAGLCRRSDLPDQESQRQVAREGNLRASIE